MRIGAAAVAAHVGTDRPAGTSASAGETVTPSTPPDERLASVGAADHVTLGVLTSGGDAPGMNAAVWAACDRASTLGWRVLGIEGGFRGLSEGRVRELDGDTTLPWGREGGTRLGTSRLVDFASHVQSLDAALGRLGIGRLLVLGGDGSLFAAAMLAERRLVVGVPATIDNDVADSESSIGFATAVESGLNLIDSIRDTAESLPRAFALETLGGATGFLAAAVAEAGAADVALLPEAPVALPELVARVRRVLDRRGYAVIVASEGYPDLEGLLAVVSAEMGVRIRLTRVGHAQRGGRPNAADRRLAHAFARSAVDHLAEGRSGRLVWQGGRPRLLPFGHEAGRLDIAACAPHGAREDSS